MAPNKKRKLSHDSPQPGADVPDADWEPQFHVVTRKKPPGGAPYTQYISSFDPTLNLYYRVQLDIDTYAWTAIKSYKAFQTDGSSVPSQKIKPGDVVAVKGSEEPLKRKKEWLETDADATVTFTWWYAQILEVRAEDPRHVYLRIVWLYKPDDLRGGRQKHHGVMEVIPSNDMQIINATTVDSLMVLKRWEKTKQGEVANAAEKPDKILLWRQTVDVTGGRQKLSPLEYHCIDGKAADPDDALIHCRSCDRWLHEECLQEQALKDYKAGKLEDLVPTAGNVPAIGSAMIDNIDPQLQKETISSPSKPNRSLVSRFVDSVASPFRSHSQEPQEVDGAAIGGQGGEPESEPACDEPSDTVNGATALQKPPKKEAAELPPTPKSPTGKLQPVKKKKGTKTEAHDLVATLRDPLADTGKAVELRQHTDDGAILMVARLRCLFKDCGEVID